MSGRKTWAYSESLIFGDFDGAPDRLTRSEPGIHSRPEKTNEKLLGQDAGNSPSISRKYHSYNSKTNNHTYETSHSKSTRKDTKDTYTDVKYSNKPSSSCSARQTNSARSTEKLNKQTTAPAGKDDGRGSKPQGGSSKQGPVPNEPRKQNQPPSKLDSKSAEIKCYDTPRESSGYGSQDKGDQAKYNKHPRASSGYSSGSNSPQGMSGKVKSDRVGSKARIGKLQVPQESLESNENGDNLKVYKDNDANRRRNRVGLPIGSVVYHKATRTVTKEQYVDTWKNRALGRVGLPRGSKPDRKNHPTTKAIQKLVKGEEIDDASLEDTEYRGLNCDLPSIKQYAKQQAICIRNRAQEEQTLLKKKKAITSKSNFMQFPGNEIPFEELTLYKKIGEGGFGEVYFAVWKNSIVAVKKLKVGGVSTRRSKQFLDEIMKCCSLQHANIVMFIGACLEKSNLSIVMEYMQMSLFEGLYIKNINLQENQKISILQQITTGLKYLHDMKTAHCDLKPQNILLSIEDDETCIAKITDFGLSMVRENSLTTSDIERAKHIGTPRYSAPEVLRGELLGASEMMKADVYSISLVYFEIIYEEEPFYNFSFSQLQKQVGKMGAIPEKPEDGEVKKQIVDLVFKGLAFNASSRPTISEIEGQWKRVYSL